MTHLVADIGGTNVRFGIVDDDTITDIDALRCADFKTLGDAADEYLKRTPVKPETGAFAVAAPLDGTDHVEMMNHVWKFSIEETKNKIGLQSLQVMNDFTALAYAVPHLTAEHLKKVGGGIKKPGYPAIVIGPGTGFGLAGVIPTADGKHIPVTSEGGHVTMPATTQREYDLFQWLRDHKYRHVSAERVISGKGMVNLYNAICGVDGLDLPARTPAEITTAALDTICPVCIEVLDLFCHFMGIIAGNAALSYGAFGGVYLGGGIIPRLEDYFDDSRFRESFEAKGRYEGYMQAIPTSVITHPYPGLEGLKQVA